jgi:hypothetical protein
MHAPDDQALVAERRFGELADPRVGAFTDRRVFRYWTLVGIVNGWPHGDPVPEDAVDAWEWVHEGASRARRLVSCRERPAVSLRDPSLERDERACGRLMGR